MMRLPALLMTGAPLAAAPAGAQTVRTASGIGRSVNTLVTSPMAQRLFAKAVIMSGGDGHSANVGGISADDPDALAKRRALGAEAVKGGSPKWLASQKSPCKSSRSARIGREPLGAPEAGGPRNARGGGSGIGKERRAP